MVASAGGAAIDFGTDSIDRHRPGNLPAPAVYVDVEGVDNLQPAYMGESRKEQASVSISVSLNYRVRSEVVVGLPFYFSPPAKAKAKRAACRKKAVCWDTQTRGKIELDRERCRS